MRYFVQVDYGIHNTYMKETVHVAKVFKAQQKHTQSIIHFPMAEATGEVV